MKMNCPGCGQHYEIEEEYAGQSVECVQCGRTFVVNAIMRQRPSLVDDKSCCVKSEGTSGMTDGTKAHVEPMHNSSAMRPLTCEMCGGTDMIKKDGVFICQACGTKYSLEEARKMMISGTVNVAGTVRVDMSEKLKNLYKIARRSRNEDNNENAARYYDLILQEDPNSWEASFYQVYFKAKGCTIANISSATNSLRNAVKSVVALIADEIEDSVQRKHAYEEVAGKVLEIGQLLDSASLNSYNEVDEEIRSGFLGELITRLDAVKELYYTCGNCLEKKYIGGDEAVSPSVFIKLWDSGIHVQFEYWCGDSVQERESYGQRILKYKHDYKMPVAYSEGNSNTGIGCGAIAGIILLVVLIFFILICLSR